MCPVTCFCHLHEGSGLTPARAHSVYSFSVLRALGGVELRGQHRLAGDKMASPSWVCKCVHLGPWRARCEDTLAQSSPRPLDSLGAFGAAPRPSRVPVLLCAPCKPDLTTLHTQMCSSAVCCPQGLSVFCPVAWPVPRAVPTTQQTSLVNEAVGERVAPQAQLGRLLARPPSLSCVITLVKACCGRQPSRARSLR